MNWYQRMIFAADVFPFDPEGDNDDPHPAIADMDHWEVANQADKVFNASGIRPQSTSNISHVAVEDGQVIGSVSSEWSQEEGDGEHPLYVFKFDVAVLPKFRGPAMVGMKLIRQAMEKYRHEKHMYQEMGGSTMMRLWVVNPRLVPVLESKFGFEVESQYGDGSAHLIGH